MKQKAGRDRSEGRSTRTSKFEYLMEPTRPLTESQDVYLRSISNSIITFGIGPAGVGKTYVAGSYAAEQLFNKNIDKIIVTRPGVEAGEKWGALPGELGEKFAPYLQPLKDVFERVLGKSQTEYYFKAGYIEAVPVGFMRGRSLDNCIILVDEAQNLTPTQMKMILTRIGENSKMIVDGDLSQKDIPGLSGLQDAVNRITGVRGVSVVEFTREDVVRSGIVQDILERY